MDLLVEVTHRHRADEVNLKLRRMWASRSWTGGQPIVTRVKVSSAVS